MCPAYFPRFQYRRRQAEKKIKIHSAHSLDQWCVSGANFGKCRTINHEARTLQWRARCELQTFVSFKSTAAPHINLPAGPIKNEHGADLKPGSNNYTFIHAHSPTALGNRRRRPPPPPPLFCAFPKLRDGATIFFLNCCNEQHARVLAAIKQNERSSRTASIVL